MTDPNYEHGAVDVVCDEIGCEYEERIFTDDEGRIDWYEFGEQMRRMGWLITTKNGTYHHFCSRHKNSKPL